MSTATENFIPRIGMVSLGCASVVMNDGQTVVIEWDNTMGSPKSEAIEMAVKSCREAGKQTATEVTDVSSNPAIPAWLATRRLTFRCS